MPLPLPDNWTDGGAEFHASDENAAADAVNALYAISTKAADYIVTLADHYIEVDATAQSITQTLPTAVGNAGKAFTFKRTDGSTATNLVTIAPRSGETIDGMSSQLLVFTGQWISVLSDGANWLMIGNNYAGTKLASTSVFTPFTTTSTTTSDSALSAIKIPGMSVTVMGAGRPVEVEFMGYGYNSTANTVTAVTLMTNAAQANGASDLVSSPETSGITAVRRLHLKIEPVLTRGTPYTFEVGVWCEAGQGHWYGSSNTLAAYPMTLAVVGQ